MESSEHNWANISETICPEILQSQTKVVGKVVQLNSTVVHFNPEKRVFSFAKYPRPPYSMVGYNRTLN